MNYQYIKHALCLLSLLLLSACHTSDIEIGTLPTAPYTPQAGNSLSLTDGLAGKTLEFRTSRTLSLEVRMPMAQSTETTLGVRYDASLVEGYNLEHRSAYEPLPETLVTLPSAPLTLGAGVRAGELSILLSSDGSLDPDKTYLLPLRLSAGGGGALPEGGDSYFVLVRDLSSLPTAEGKPRDIKIFSCMEVNDANPLNNISFTLKSSGKPLIDAVILFSSNINYNAKTGKVYLHHNENVQAILSNREKYLKPLQDRGIKVILSILGNHDRAGVANLAPETARAFAAEVKAHCDMYELDGVFLDDEYTRELRPAPPGFVASSSAGAARLCYELKRAQPERLMIVYAYSTTYSLPSVEGQEPGSFVDYALHDYGSGTDLSSNYPGLSRKGQGLYSQEYAQGRFASRDRLQAIVNGGYGAHMIFAMNPLAGNFSRQLTSMRQLAEVFYGDELVFSGIKYPADWKN